MAKDFEMGYLLDFYGEVLTPKQREMLRQYYNDDLSSARSEKTSASPGRGRGTPSSMAKWPSRSWKKRSASRPGTAGCSRHWKSWSSWSSTPGLNAPARTPG